MDPRGYPSAWLRPRTAASVPPGKFIVAPPPVSTPGYPHFGHNSLGHSLTGRVIDRIASLRPHMARITAEPQMPGHQKMKRWNSCGAFTRRKPRFSLTRQFPEGTKVSLRILHGCTVTVVVASYGERSRASCWKLSLLAATFYITNRALRDV
jgi:hypothetical protein